VRESFGPGSQPSSPKHRLGVSLFPSREETCILEVREENEEATVTSFSTSYRDQLDERCSAEGAKVASSPMSRMTTQLTHRAILLQICGQGRRRNDPDV